MAVRDVSVSCLPPGYLGFNGGAELGHRLFGYGTASLLARSEPFYEFQVQPQVGSYMEASPRVLQRQRNPLQNRLDPFQGSGFALRGGGGVL
ncbi:hypothetical protein GH714_037703 [Hevea brasiliensis]|uniref:Uncharacterized protein n=1 Tax=Hevea brasiliensis TaxID=3981 RepID=A0A6A6KQD3_HEVBR|nr:hypothetical protein GH714_037703 [Hevea brasiliensis]